MRRRLNFVQKQLLQLHDINRTTHHIELANRASASSPRRMAARAQPASEHPKLLWNPENVRDVAESVGISSLNDDALRCLSQDVEYRIGQVIVESLRFMRAANRTTLTVQDVAQALRVLDVEPLYGYDSTRSLRYGEASLGPGQPLFYLEDEEVDFEKLINAPLPKVPRDMTFTSHWLAVEGVQPNVPQNPTSAETGSKELLPKGPGANPALAALAGNDNVAFRPVVKHVISKELILYFDKIQAALLDDNPDEEVQRLRAAALESVRSDPGLHQLLPYFVSFITNQVTHRLDDTFVLRQMMELTEAVISNPNLFLDPYASSLCAAVLTCLMGRKLGGDESSNEQQQQQQQSGASGESESSSAGTAAASGHSAAQRAQYQLRELSAALLGKLARAYGATNALLRPKLTRTCLKFFLDPARPPPVLFGAVSGVAAAGGPEAVRVLVLPNLRSVDAAVLQPLAAEVERRKEAAGGGAGAAAAAAALLDYEMLVGGIVKAVQSVASGRAAQAMAVEGRANGAHNGDEAVELAEFLGPVIGQRIAGLGDPVLNSVVLDARQIE